MYSKAILIGNLTRDPTTRYTTQGTAVTKFSVAVNRRYKDTDEVSFFDVTAFGAVGEVCGKYLTRGRAVLVDGRLKQDRWETDQGQRRSKVVIVANEVKFLDRRDDAGEQGTEPPGGNPSGVTDDEVPF